MLLGKSSVEYRLLSSSSRVRSIYLTYWSDEVKVRSWHAHFNASIRVMDILGDRLWITLGLHFTSVSRLKKRTKK